MVVSAKDFHSSDLFYSKLTLKAISNKIYAASMTSSVSVLSSEASSSEILSSTMPCFLIFKAKNFLFRGL